MTMTDDMRTVSVGLGDRAYDIAIGPGALSACTQPVAALVGKGKAVIVVDETVWDLHSDAITEAFEDIPVIKIPGGEKSKSFTQYALLCEDLLATEIGRDGVIIAIGGGVVGDLAGFVAATLRRGCAFVQVPTTLLAQVDSSVGGKTAINTRAGKNLIGAFWQPRLVIADTALLATLPDREIRAGYAEIVKYGLLGDSEFFGWLDQNGKHVLDLENRALVKAVGTSCAAKAAIVAEDEKEAGRRALLNLGHTFGHALEAVMGYSGSLLHGEAVAAGMAMAFRFSVRMGHCAQDDADRVKAHLSAHGLPTGPGDIADLKTSADQQLALMYQDKKVEGGALTLILVRSIGDAFVAKDVDPAPVLEFLQDEISAIPS